MNLLLDTTVLVDVLRGRQNRPALLADLVDRQHVLSVTTINVAEVYAGLRPSEEARAEVFFSRVDIYPLTVTIARLAGELKNGWSKKGRTFGIADMIVAATALEHGLTLMTDNRKDFPMPELCFYDLP